MGIFSGFQSYLCAGSGEIFSAVENEEQSFTLQKSVENFTAQQNTLLHSRKLRKASFATENAEMSRCRNMQKTLLHSRNLRRVNPVAEIGKKFFLRQKQGISPFCSIFPWTLDSTFTHKPAAAEWYLEAHFAECQTQLPSQKKPKLIIVQ